eukprot:TRINITY_DN6734_c0_g1_i1.p1 TRINITY_DN6734_c0_g1~~TRINITY_DN6734_c0_g1_i1.p1  ORF type:complete len:737 (-),score=224.23 TRINITY_DN6734_c0_g1_i1:205-2379(-)
MSSFVRAVLSASGALSTKEDLPSTISRLSKRGEELKALLRVEVESSLESLGPAEDIKEAISKLESVKGEMESLQCSISAEKTSSGGSTSEEMDSLLSSLESLSGTIQVAGSIRSAWEQHHLLEEALGLHKTLEAARISRELGTILAEEPSDEDQLKAFKAIRMEYIASMDILQEALYSFWDKEISIEPNKDGSRIRLVYRTSPQLVDLFSALSTAGLLEDKLKLFAESLLSHVLLPIMKKSASILAESPTCLQITLDPSSSSSSQPHKILDQLRTVLSLLSNDEHASISPEVPFISALGDIIRDRFLSAIMNDILSPSIPHTKRELDAYSESMGNALESLESYLRDISFLPRDSCRLMDFVLDLETLFVNKKLCTYLQEARELMKRPLYETLEVSPDRIKEEGALLKLTSKVGSFPLKEEDLPLPDDKATPHHPFHFPGCRISKATWEVKALIYRMLDEAAEDHNTFVSSRLLVGARYVFELYLNMISIAHEGDFEKLPQVSAVAHNDCFYLAHQCLLLGIHYREHFLRGQEPILTFIDFIPSLRETGETLLKRQIEAQREILLDHVEGLDVNAGNTELTLKRIRHGLHHLKKVWAQTLPSNIYPRIMGTLINSALEGMIGKVVVLDNIVTDSAVQTYNAFTEFEEDLPSLFDGEYTPMKVVRYWLRFKELIFVLNANLKEIEHRWAERKGPLAAEFSVDEIKRLIRAIFQNTERRATVLSRIK